MICKDSDQGIRVGLGSRKMGAGAMSERAEKDSMKHPNLAPMIAIWVTYVIFRRS